MVLAIQQILKRPKVNTTVLQFLKACFNIFAFIILCILCFGHIEGHDWWNQPVTGWDENKTDESWGVYLWNWDWIDCMYFAMVTMCTVGYGDMPTLPQSLRIFNIFFATLGVIFVAGSITTIVNFFAEQGRKRFILKQRMLIEDAHRAAELVKQQQRDGADGVPEPPPSPPADERAYEKAEESQPKYPIWDRLIWSRLPKRKKTLKVLAALRPTGAFFCLCIILGELENSQIEGCGGFGAGWRCGGNTGCDEWKLSHELGGYCWSWIDSVRGHTHARAVTSTKRRVEHIRAAPSCDAYTRRRARALPAHPHRRLPLPATSVTLSAPRCRCAVLLRVHYVPHDRVRRRCAQNKGRQGARDVARHDGPLLLYFASSWARRHSGASSARRRKDPAGAAH